MQSCSRAPERSCCLWEHLCWSPRACGTFSCPSRQARGRGDRYGSGLHIEEPEQECPVAWDCPLLVAKRPRGVPKLSSRVQLSTASFARSRHTRHIRNKYDSVATVATVAASGGGLLIRHVPLPCIMEVGPFIALGCLGPQPYGPGTDSIVSQQQRKPDWIKRLAR